MNILFKITSRSRPDKFYATLNSIFDNCVSDNYSVLVSLDEDDAELEKYKKIFISPVPMYWEYGLSKNKIDAINRDMDKAVCDWDILVNVSDDQIFIRKGFDDVIRFAFTYQTPNQKGLIFSQYSIDLDQFVHFPDGNRSDLATMSVMGRTYYDRYKYIYHPDYISVYCDNEAQDVAKIRGCYKFVDNQIFSHEHPAYSKGSYDELYQKNDRYYHDDQATYERRKLTNFGL